MLDVASIVKAVLLIVLLISKAESDHVNDPEPDVTWTPPKDDADFKTSLPEANYSGLLWAGHWEFNWVVDIRGKDTDQEHWAIGNLISYYHVVTTHRAVDALQAREVCKADKVNETGYRWSKEVYKKCVSDIRIFYCQDYLWTDGHSSTDSPSDQDMRLTGWRAPKEIIRHESYASNDLSLANDVAVIVLNKGIRPIPPRLGYMPTGYDYATDHIEPMVKMDPTKEVTYSSPVCYVASFGRNSANHKEFYTLDYKVKFRVYITPWKTCLDSWKYICNANGTMCKDPEKYGNVSSIMCFRPRAKVGTVCDHDKGAPLVCNGKVVGLVILGAVFPYCANLYKTPFVAESIDLTRVFLQNSISYLVHPVPLKEGPTEAPSRAEAKDHGTGTGKPSCNIGSLPMYLILTGYQLLAQIYFGV